MKLAITLRAADIDTMHVLDVPLHAPLQPVKVDPADAMADSVTRVPALNWALHRLPQLMPEGLDTTVPLPVPALVTLST